MKRSRIDLGNGLTVESYRDMNGRVYIAHAGGTSLFLHDTKTLRQFLRLAPKTPSRDALDAWLEGLDAKAPAAAAGVAAEPAAELQATGFGPECHDGSLDPTDPNHSTRTIT